MSWAYRISLLFLSLTCLLLISYILYHAFKPSTLRSPLGSTQNLNSTSTSKTLMKYTFQNLMDYAPHASQIKYPEILESLAGYSSYRFNYQTENKTMTGQLNVPNIATPSGGFPIVLMLRGFVDPAIYETGMGTKNAAAAFAQNGYVTLSPDFLGYGGSDPPDPDVIGERVQKPLHILDLLASIPSLSFVNPENIFIWAHSNGGQIALSVLEITGKPIPTTLWAPVSKPFPYSILYYSDEADDQGKALRLNLALFESNYTASDYSIDQFWSKLKGPLQIHQGSADTAVPLNWSTALAMTLDDLGIKTTLFSYPGADHNLKPSWDTAITRDLTFFKSYILN